MSPQPQIPYKVNVTINVPMALPVPWHPGVPLNMFTRSWGHLITVSIFCLLLKRLPFLCICLKHPTFLFPENVFTPISDKELTQVRAN